MCYDFHCHRQAELRQKRQAQAVADAKAEADRKRLEAAKVQVFPGMTSPPGPAPALPPSPSRSSSSSSNSIRSSLSTSSAKPVQTASSCSESTWPPAFRLEALCKQGHGIAVDATRGVVVVSSFNSDYMLYVYSLADGSMKRWFGGQGAGKGQFHWAAGGLCMTPRGTVLVAEYYHNRLQEVSIEDGSWVRFVGEGVLERPQRVHCSETVIAVSDTDQHCVTLVSWVDGSLLARCGSGLGSGNGQLNGPRGLRLLANGGGVVVADTGNDRLCVFSLAGEFVRAVCGGKSPRDVVECDGDASFIVANLDANTVSKVSAATGVVTPFGATGTASGQFSMPAALALVDSDPRSASLVVMDFGNKRFQVFSLTSASPSVASAAVTMAAVPVAAGAVTVPLAVTIDSDSSPLAVSWPPVGGTKAPCVKGHGIAVDVARARVVVSGDADKKLYVYSLADGLLVRSFGGAGAGKGQFNWSYGGLCVTPRGTVLVAERGNKRLQEVDVDDGSHVRFVADDGALAAPDYVDCSDALIAVAETMRHRVTLLSWATGKTLAWFGGHGHRDGQLESPQGLRLLADGSGVVVADCRNHRLCVFSTAGAFLRSVDVSSPCDVAECDAGACFLVVNAGDCTLWKVPAVPAPARKSWRSYGAGKLNSPVAVAVVAGAADWDATMAEAAPGVGTGTGTRLVVLESEGKQFQVLRA